MSRDDRALPGSSFCVGCRHMTFRQRADGLCPRCAWEAEQLIEQIELSALADDLATLVSFEAYCRTRDTRVRESGPPPADELPVVPVTPPDSRPWPDQRPA